MRRLLEVSLWLLFLALPALVAMSTVPDRHPPIPRVESSSTNEEGLGTRWFSLFGSPHGEGGPAFVRRRLSVGVAWLLMSIGVVFFVSSACGRLPAAAAALATAVHPVVRDIGALATPWLPAAVFTWISMLFLQTIALPTVYRRKAHSWRAFGIRFLGMVGSGVSLGLAASAWPRVVWAVLVVGSLFLLSLVFLGVAGWRVRHKRPLLGFVDRPWAWIRRSGIWAIAWFVVLSLFLQIFELFEETPAPLESAYGIQATGTTELVLAWLSLPGILLLGMRTGAALWYRSRLSGRTVLFVTLLLLWCFGPAVRESADPMQRLLAVPVFAASLAGVLERLRRD